MAFSLESGKPIALIKGGDDDGEILFVDQSSKCVCAGCSKKNCKRHPCCGGCCWVCKKGHLDSKDLVIGGMFELVPNMEDRCQYIAGPSGSGKSTFAGKLIEKYRKMNPEAPFFVFSRLGEDPALDHLDPHRVQINEDLIENPIDITEEVVPGTVILFDDISTLSDKKLQTAVNKLMKDVLEIGRHLDIKIVITNHLINPSDRDVGRTILNEMHTLTIFPSAGSSYQIMYCLKNYFGFSRKQIKAVLDMPSRFVTLVKSYPQIVLSESRCCFVSELG